MKDNRERIIKASVNLFNRAHDSRRVSLESIAREAGVSPATVYNIFGDRETLIEQVVQKIMLDNLEAVRSVIQSDKSFPEKLRAIAMMKASISGNEEVLDKLTSADLMLSTFVDELYDQQIKPLWIDLIRDGKAKGYVAHDLSEKAVLTYLDLLRAGIKAKPDLLDGIKDDPDAIGHLSKMMFSGFLVDVAHEREWK
jgi:AcrR family transcriptional regulator